ncbi:hypothetical protein CPB97_009639 [Podila verticillata]|nr:hypothetical protein CPB97_009639 [Podila verticillata]
MSEFLPQLIEFATQLDLQKLIVTQTTLSLLAAIRNVPAYNIPLLFFGLYAYQHHDSVEPLQQFAGFTAFSMLADITWLLLSEFIGFGEIITIILLIFKPLTIISALQLLKFRGDPFSSLGGGMDWSLGQRGQGGSSLAYQSLADGMEDERDAQEINIPRHSHGGGRNRQSQQSGSFVTNSTTTNSTSSRTNSLKSGRAGSTNGGVLQHTHQNNNNNYEGYQVGGVHAGDKDDRRDKVGHANLSDEDAEVEEGDVSSGHHGSPKTGESTPRAGYQPF